MTPARWTRRHPRAAALCIFAACALACSRESPGDRPPPEAANAGMDAAPLPDLSPLDPLLREQLRAEYAALEAGTTAGRQRAEQYGRIGTLLLAAEYPEAAEAFFLNAQEANGADMRWPYYLGHVYRATHRLDEAVASFSGVLRLDPNHVPSLVWLGDTHLALGAPAAAEPYLAKAVALDPSSLAAWLRRGRAALAGGDAARAVEHLERALAIDPGADAVHYQLGLAYRDAGNRVKAEQHLQRRADAAAIAPADALMEALPALLQTGAAHLTRGIEAMERRDWPAAAGHLRTATELSPNDGVAHLNLGTALYLAGDAAAARRALEAAVRVAPGLPKAHYTLALVAEAEGRDAEAIERLTAAVRLDPEYVEAHVSLADALRRNGRVEPSLAHYAKVLAVDPAASQARFGYAMALVRLGRYREARDWLRQAASLHPEQLGFAHALARVLAAAPDDAVRNGREALQITEQLLRGQRSPALAETMAMALAELGRFDEAIGWQQEAIDAARAAGQPAAAAAMQANLTGYQRGQPCRTPWAADDPVHRPRPLA